MAYAQGVSSKDPDAADFKVENGNVPIAESRIFGPVMGGRRIVGRHGYRIAGDAIAIDDHTWIAVCDVIHHEGSVSDWDAFWTLKRIPRLAYDPDKGERAEAVIVDVDDLQTDDWIKDRLKRAGRAVDFGAGEVASKTSTTGDTNARRVSQRVRDINDIAAEINDYASGYLQTQMRVLIKANSRALLDRIIADINRQYVDSFKSGVTLVPRPGVQRTELRDLLGTRAGSMAGRGHWFTTREYGGAYDLVTHGVRDKGGEYVGRLFSDYNSSAVLVDFADLGDSTVIAMSDHAGPDSVWLGRHPELRGLEKRRFPLVHLWGAKIAQATLLAGHRVVQFGMDDTDLTAIGTPLKRLTTKVDVGRGEVNIMEFFDSRPADDGSAQGRRRRLENLPSVYSAQIDKLTTITHLLAGDAVNAVGDAQLAETLNDFYIDRRMYRSDAKDHPERLRLITPHHDQVPTLALFHSFLAERKGRNGGHVSGVSDDAVNILEAIYSRLLNKDGDLFNVTTSPSMDGTVTSPRVVYDFSDLTQRGDEVALAQLVNLFGYAASNLQGGDVIVIHGAEILSGSPVASEYIRRQQTELSRRGVHMVYLYTTGPEAALKDRGLNHLATAGMTVFGRMTDACAREYEELINERMTEDLRAFITQSIQPGLVYMHRGAMDNALFLQDLLLGYAPGRDARRRAILGDTDASTIIPYVPVAER